MADDQLRAALALWEWTARARLDAPVTRFAAPVSRFAWSLPARRAGCRGRRWRDRGRVANRRFGFLNGLSGGRQLLGRRCRHADRLRILARRQISASSGGSEARKSENGECSSVRKHSELSP